MIQAEFADSHSNEEQKNSYDESLSKIEKPIKNSKTHKIELNDESKQKKCKD